jgi:hypothetical protein
MQASISGAWFRGGKVGKVKSQHVHKTEVLDQTRHQMVRSMPYMYRVSKHLCSSAGEMVRDARQAMHEARWLRSAEPAMIGAISYFGFPTSATTKHSATYFPDSPAITRGYGGGSRCNVGNSDGGMQPVSGRSLRAADPAASRSQRVLGCARTPFGHHMSDGEQCAIGMVGRQRGLDRSRPVCLP